MGIHDRDYMRDDRESSSEQSTVSLIVRAVIVAVSLFLIFTCLRLPLPFYVKLPVLIGLGFLIRFLWSVPRKVEGGNYLKRGLIEEGRGEFSRAAYNYEKAAERLPNHPYVIIRLLSAYHSTNRVNRAQDLIKEIDGNVFPKEVVEELDFLVSKYRAARFEEVGERSRLNLGNN